MKVPGLRGFAAIAAFTASTSSAADCDASSFGVLATSPTVALCMKDTNISLLTLDAEPTSDQLTLICKTPMCRELLQILVNLDPVECTVPLVGRFHLRGDLIDPTVAHCSLIGLPLKKKGSTSESSSSSGGSETVQLATKEPPQHSNGGSPCANVLSFVGITLGIQTILNA